jgi:hypothetical protein
MAPPDHASSDSHGRYSHYLAEHNFKDNPRLGENVDRLSAWLEFLLHPETHDYDREVYGPFESTGGTWVWREQPERMYNYDTGDGEEFDSRSVLHGYKYSDFLDPLVAVSTQQVERGDSLLALATAAVNNIYWVGTKLTSELDDFPSEWKSPASVEAERFVSRLESVANQMNLVVHDLKELLPKYALIIKAARVNLDKAVEGLVEKFEEKFATKSQDGGFSFDVMGLVLTTIAAAAVTYMTVGGATAITEAMVVAAWSKTFDEATKELLGDNDKRSLGKIAGYWWKDLAKSYLEAVDGIMRNATEAMNHLNGEMAQLAQNFKQAVPGFTDKLPQLDKAPNRKQ